jgi:Fur family ferric uptake transcriptional regulator
VNEEIMERKTTQRRAILNALEEADRPLGPQEIHDMAQKEVPKIGIATVYRSIRSFLEEGLIRQVDLPDSAARYEIAGKRHHHHFHCRKCDRVFEVMECAHQVKKMAPPGFLLETHEIILYGVCPDCQQVN